MLFVKESQIAASPEKVFAFHEQPDAIKLLMPPWDKSIIVQAAPSLQTGSRTIIDAKILGPIRKRWIAEHTQYDPPRMFEDTQVDGPFASWRHRHIVKPDAVGALLRDEIEYDPPIGLIGRLFAPIMIVPRLARLFEYRHRVTKEWCESKR